ncbi:ATP-binding cassette domain-containing protein [Mycobacterium tuberculosis]|uniref:ATP-binding cassette domain-containing protein n=1 Tax=Mycobacterium tuberculosis TaxID=1773 RepID=UPI0032B55A9F
MLLGDGIFNYRDVLEFRRRVGMLFQRPNPFPMSIMDNVLAGVRAHKLVPRKEFRGVAQARLTEVGLWDAGQGSVQRFTVSTSAVSSSCCAQLRTLAVNPEVLLLDEPTSALDPDYHREDRRVHPIARSPSR